MLKYLAIFIIPAFLSSCGAMKTMQAMKDGTVSGLNKVADFTTAPFKPGVPVVEARQNEWEELPSGQDQALAFQEQQRKKRGFWFFGGGADFDEPELPQLGAPATASLLPPKQ